MDKQTILTTLIQKVSLGTPSHQLESLATIITKDFALESRAILKALYESIQLGCSLVDYATLISYLSSDITVQIFALELPIKFFAICHAMGLLSNFHDLAQSFLEGSDAHVYALMGRGLSSEYLHSCSGACSDPMSR